MMGSIVSVNMSSYEQMCAFTELSNMNDDQSESNKMCYEYYTHEESLWNILYFKIVQQTKGLFFVCLLGGLFFDFQPGLL